MFGPYYDYLLQDCEQLLDLSERFRRAEASGDSDVQRSTSAEALGRMDRVAIATRRAHEGEAYAGQAWSALMGCEVGLIVDPAREDQWPEVVATKRLPRATSPKPLKLYATLNKNLHTRARAYRIDGDAHVLISYGLHDRRPWIAEWSVAAYVAGVQAAIRYAAEKDAERAREEERGRERAAA